MPDLIVLVPGITGSVLKDGTGRTVWNRSVGAVASAARHPLATVGKLALPAGIGDATPQDATGLVAGSPIGGWHVWPGLHSGDGYDAAVGVAATLGTAARGFGYDWRLSNRVTAALLGRQAEEWLHQWRRESGDRDALICFVAHSMGGLVVRYALEVLGWRPLARRVVTLGTPYSGSVKAVRALTGHAFEKVPFIGERLTETVRTFPSLYQLLPVYRCVRTPAGPQPLSEVDIPGLPIGADTDARRFREEISSAQTRNGPLTYELNILIGTRSDTLQSVAVTSRGVEYLEEQREVDHGGDGTVPTFSAVPSDWTDTSAAEAFAIRHTSLASASICLDALRNKMSPVRLGAALHPPVEIGLGLPDITTFGEGIEVRAHSERQGLLLRASVRDPDSGVVVASQQLRPRPDGSYSGTVRPPPALWRVEVTAVAERPLVTTSDLVLVTE